MTVAKDDIQSFSVDYFKFVRATIAVDETPNNLRTRATRRNPDWIIKTVFLKVLVKGKKDLLLYDDNKLRKFYYTDSYDTITPLVYRKYSTNAATISENNMYQQQLFNYVNCNVTTDDVLKVNNNLESLEDYFVKYNKCEGEQPTIFTEVKRKNVIHLTPKINGGLVRYYFLIVKVRHTAPR